MRPVALSLTLILALTGAGCSSTSSSSSSQTHAQDGPLRSLALLRQGSVLIQQGRHKEALKRFEEADQAAPNNATTQNMIGLCHLNLQEYDQALIFFDRALNLVPSFTDARNNRGSTYLQLGQYRLAEVDFTAVLSDSTYPHRWSVFYNLGMANLGRRQLGAAEENLRRSVTAPAPIFEGFLQLAQLYQEQGKVEQAIELLEDAILRFPDRPDAHFALGRLLTQLGRYEEARPHLEQVIATHPDHPLADDARAYLEEG